MKRILSHYQKEYKNSKWAAFLDGVTELLYPRRCPYCNEITPSKENLICPDCLKIVRNVYEIRQPACFLCGKELNREEEEYCYECLHHRRSFDGGVSLFRYGRARIAPVAGHYPGYENHSMGDSILRFKYYYCKDYGEFYIDELMYCYGRKIFSFHADVIIPVPVHPLRRSYRGYNQARVLADQLSLRTAIPVDESLLVRAVKTMPQKGLGYEKRLKNLEKAFDITGKAPKKWQTAILIDDILTTGSTMEACANKLKKAGIRNVYCISICSGHI